MTASRARSNDIGNERAKSRIGTRRTLPSSTGSEPPIPDDFFDGFFPAIVIPQQGFVSTGIRLNRISRFATLNRNKFLRRNKRQLHLIDFI